MTDRPATEQERLRREIEQTREELGATVEALSHKADVKAQMRERIDYARAQVRERTHAPERPVVPIAVGIGVALALLVAIRRR
jgi:Protein of unknown function (DUF3618)